MIDTIKKMLGFGPSVNYAELVKNGAQIIDVNMDDALLEGDRRPKPS